ncbi:hypothetical protein JAAARDRAFT_94968, partial [Jaapia argillacea MUCL 33604]
FRCINCFGRPFTCLECCRNEHDRLPFHRIERWTGKYFAWSSLFVIGHMVYLGHGGKPCP